MFFLFVPESGTPEMKSCVRHCITHNCAICFVFQRSWRIYHCLAIVFLPFYFLQIRNAAVRVYRRAHYHINQSSYTCLGKMILGRATWSADLCPSFILPSLTHSDWLWAWTYSCANTDTFVLPSSFLFAFRLAWNWTLRADERSVVSSFSSAFAAEEHRFLLVTLINRTGWFFWVNENPESMNWRHKTKLRKLLQIF